MEYISSVETAKKWGITPTRVTILAKNGLIPGAKQIGSRWMIPENAVKPRDGRRKSVQAERKTAPFFRYPALAGRAVASFSPPLRKEELQLKRTLDAFYACRFEEFEQFLDRLWEQTGDRYCRITALRLACMSCIYRCESERFLEYYGKLTVELQSDFPRKPEMEAMIHELDATLGDNHYFQNDFRLEPGYTYHESFLPHLAALNTIALFCNAGKNVTPALLRSFEINCALLDTMESPVDTQTVHLYLGFTYAVLGMNEKATSHLHRALELAERYELYYGVATEYFYLVNAFEPALEGFSPEFVAHLRTLSESIHSRYVMFMDQMSANSVFKLLFHKEFIFVLYAVQGYQNKEIAELLHISQRTVGKRYSEIYDMLDVKSKKELVELYNHPRGRQGG